MSEGPPSEPETTTPKPDELMLIGLLEAPFRAGAEVFDTTGIIGSGIIDGTYKKKEAPDVSFDNKENKEV